MRPPSPDAPSVTYWVTWHLTLVHHQSLNGSHGTFYGCTISHLMGHMSPSLDGHATGGDAVVFLLASWQCDLFWLTGVIRRSSDWGPKQWVE